MATLYSGWHVFRWHSFTHAIHFAIPELLAGPSDFLQQCAAWQQCIGPARISNGWLIWRGFLQVLLEIMSAVVIFECCLQGLSAFLLYLRCTETDEAPIRGWHCPQACQRVPVSLCGQDRADYTQWGSLMRRMDGNTHTRLIWHFFHCLSSTIDWLFSLVFCRFWSLVFSLDNSVLLI